MPSSNSSVTSGSPKRNWIREASMKRLNMLMRNKAECLTDTFADNSINLNDLERSGLNDIERNTIDRWIRGQLSGRHCLLALLEHRLVESEEKNIKSFTTGAVQHPIEFEMLSSSLSLPNDFLCDSGYLYESTFSKPPGTVIKEALQMLATKAMEKNISSLRVDQINLSLKQLRVDMLHDSVMSIDNEKGKENSSDNTLIKSHNTNTDGNNDTSLMANKVSNNKEANTYRLSILIELIRWHIRTNHKDYNNDENNNNKQKESNHKNMKGNGNNNGNNDSELHKTVKSSPFSSSSSSSFFSHSSSHIDAATVVKHLDCNLERVVEEAKQLSTDDLEQLNILLKPYVRQLSSLKSSLTIQLKDFEEKKAYISLGVSKDASDSVIRKAYHSKAVQLHPDKPGGDTAKFQALQTCYQEIINKRKTEHVSTNVTLSPAAQEESLQANNILKELASCLDLIKAAADKCTQLGHLNIQFQKSIEKSSKKEFPEGVKCLVKLMDDSNNKSQNHTSTTMKKNHHHHMNGHKVDMTSCAPAIAVSYVEAVCESMQILSALSMKLPSCGFRYGLATAINSKYMKAVEKAMATGLSAMRVVSALISANDQIYLCRKKLLESATQGIDNSDIHEILVDMIVTSFNSATMTVQMAADKCVDAAINAADLYGIIKSIIHSAEEEAINEAKRTAAREEKDADLCEEDRVFMAERSKQAREEAMAQHKEEEDDLMNLFEKKDKKKSKDTTDKTADNDDDDDDDEDLNNQGKIKKQNKPAKEKEEDEEAYSNIESLRDKIKALQLQLRLQHIQALQSLNTEARTLQLQLQQQLYDIVIGTVNTENIAHKMIIQKQTIARQQQLQQQEQQAVVKAEDDAVTGSNIDTINPSKHITSTTTTPPVPAAVPAAVPVQPLRNSVLSLLADFIDSSCSSLREELDNDDDDDGNNFSALLLLKLQQPPPAAAIEKINSSNNNDNSISDAANINSNITSDNNTPDKLSMELLLRQVLYKHLGWMTVLNSSPRVMSNHTCNTATTNNNNDSSSIRSTHSCGNGNGTGTGSHNKTNTMPDDAHAYTPNPLHTTTTTCKPTKTASSSSPSPSSSSSSTDDNSYNTSNNSGNSYNTNASIDSNQPYNHSISTPIAPNEVTSEQDAYTDESFEKSDNHDDNTNYSDDDEEEEEEGEGEDVFHDVVINSMNARIELEAALFECRYYQNMDKNDDDDDDILSPDVKDNDGHDNDDDDDDEESTFDVVNELRKSFDNNNNISMTKTTTSSSSPSLSDNDYRLNITPLHSPTSHTTTTIIAATAATGNVNITTNDDKDKKEIVFVDIDEGVYTTRESSARQSPSQELPKRYEDNSSSSSSLFVYDDDSEMKGAMHQPRHFKTTNTMNGESNVINDDNTETPINTTYTHDDDGDDDDDNDNQRSDDDTPQASSSSSNTSSSPPPPLFSTSETKSLNILRVGPKLALLPDYRSKTLWLSALVDEEAVVSLVSLELKARLADCLKRVLVWSSTRTTTIIVEDHVNLPISSSQSSSLSSLRLQQQQQQQQSLSLLESMTDDLCELIVEGVKSAVQELRVVNTATNTSNSANASASSTC